MRKIFVSMAVLLLLGSSAATSLTSHAASAPLQWTWGNPTPSGGQFNAVAFGGGIYVAAGQDGALVSSPDGSHWTPYTGGFGVGGNYSSALYAGGQFVLAGVGPDGTSHITVSSDGVHWTDTQLSLNNDGKIGLAYGNGTYVALSGSSDATSPDGVNWTVHALGFEQAKDQGNLSLPDGRVDDLVIYANLVFIGYGEPAGSAGANQSVYYSTDNGVTWAASGTAACGAPFVSNGSGFFSYYWTNFSPVSVCTSTDGKNWARQNTTGLPSDALRPIVWNGTGFVMQNGQTYTSSDGINWTGNGISKTGPALTSAVAAGSGYLAAVHGPLSLATSPDFATWTTQSFASGVTNAGWNDVVYGGGQYVAVGIAYYNTLYPGSAILESNDGLNWNQVYASGTSSTTSSTPPLLTVAYGNGQYVAAGNDWLNAGGHDSLWLSSPDGISWSPITNPPSGLPVSDLAYGNGMFVVFVGNCESGGTCGAAVSSDGKNWTNNSMPSNLQNQRNLAFGNGKFVTLTSDTAYSSTDGITWTAGTSFTVAQNTHFIRVRSLGNGFGAVGSYTPPCMGAGSQCIDIPSYPVVALSADGATWSANILNTPVFPQAFLDIASDGTHYFLTTDDSFQDALAMSSDGKEWCSLSGFSVAAHPNTIVTNGTQIAAAGSSGAVLSSPLATGAGGSSVTCNGATYSILSVPSISGGGGGSGSTASGNGSSGGGALNLATLAALFTLLALRRRASL